MGVVKIVAKRISPIEDEDLDRISEAIWSMSDVMTLYEDDEQTTETTKEMLEQ